MTPPAVRTYGRWLLVPVIDEDDDSVLCWDVHPDVTDWSSVEPVATGTTQALALAELRVLLRRHRVWGLPVW